MELTVATLENRAAVVGLWRECGLTRPWNDPGADYIAAVEGVSSAVLLLRSDGKLLATVMTGFDGHRGWVYYLAVASDRQREGLGGRMMAEAENWLRQNGAPKIQLMVRLDNKTAIGFYEAIGLERQPVVTLGNRLDDDR